MGLGGGASHPHTPGDRGSMGGSPLTPTLFQVNSCCLALRVFGLLRPATKGQVTLFQVIKLSRPEGTDCYPTQTQLENRGTAAIMNKWTPSGDTHSISRGRWKGRGSHLA